jgi:hypothetical protein
MKAFPSEETITTQPPPNYTGSYNGSTYVAKHTGMDLRDYFAAKAMQAMIGQCEGGNFDDFVIATQAYQMADFMIKERNGEGFYADAK